MKTKKNTSKSAERRRETQKALRTTKSNKTWKPSHQVIGDLIRIKRMKSEMDQKRSGMFFYIGLSISLALIYIIFNWNFPNNHRIVQLGEEEALAFEEFHEIPQTVQPPPPPPQLSQPPRIIEVSDEVIIEEVDIVIDVESSEEMTVDEVIYDLPPMEEEVAEEVFYTSETSPEPVGGLKAFYAFVRKNLKYPHQARSAQVKGRVFIQFVVDKDGSLTNFKLLKGIGHGCDEEAMRVLALSPQWNPGKQRGVPVKVYMTMPIHFELK